jgi:hypothetical protein
MQRLASWSFTVNNGVDIGILNKVNGFLPSNTDQNLYNRTYRKDRLGTLLV